MPETEAEDQVPARAGRGARPASPGRARQEARRRRDLRALEDRNRELARANADLENVLESLGIPLAILDRDLRLRRLSRTAQALLAQPGEGRRLTEVRPALDLADALDLLRQAAATGALAEREVRDGTGHWYSLRAHPYRTAAGEVDGAVLALLDIDLEKRATLRERRERVFAEAVLDTMREPLAVLGAELGVERANAAFHRRFGAAQGPLDVALGCPALREPLLRTLAFNRPVADLEVHCAPGRGPEVLLVNASRIPLDDGPPPRVVVTLTDVTGRRRARAELERLQRQETERLRGLNRFKAVFIAAAAHELANPLTPIDLQVKVLERRLGDDPAAAHAVAILRRSAARLRAVVDDMAVAARFESGRLELHRRRLDLAALARDVLETYRDAAAAARLGLAADLREAWVEADPAHLERVVANLLSNALKYTPAGGHVRVEVAAEAATACLRVADDGIGLAPDALERLFRPFSRVHDPALQVPGTGLGLYICKGIVELHGGRLAVHSGGPRCGTTFTLELPLA